MTLSDNLHQKKSLTKPLPKLAVLISGRGSNMVAIHQAVLEGRLHASIALVVSNTSTAKGLTYAKENNLPFASLIKKKNESREAYDTRLVDLLNRVDHALGVDAVVLAGYNRIVSDVLLTAFEERVINIHPSLLPLYGGYKMVGEAVHQAVLENKETVSGCTVHLVTPEVDAGTVLGQAKVCVLPEDTVEKLADRVLHQEHQLYSAVLSQWLNAQFNTADFQPVMIDSTIEANIPSCSVGP